MVAQQLTNGGLRAICIDQKAISLPVFQILGTKKVPGGQKAPGGQSADRYRLLLSDSINVLSSAMLATQLNPLIDSGELNQFCIVEVGKYLCNQVQDRTVMILLEVKILQSGTEIGQKIGDPQALNTSGAGQPQQQNRTQDAVSKQDPSSHNMRPLGGGIQQQQQPAQPKPNFYGNAGVTPPNKGYGAGGGAAGAAFNRNLPRTPGGGTVTVHPIAALTPYQNKWTIKARVTNKTGIKTWSNARGEGKLFSLELLDQSGEIRATAFKAECDKFFDIIEVDKVYYISKGTLKTANKQYTSINNDYEMTFNTETTVVRCDDEDNSTPKVSYNFTTIDGLQQVQKDSMVDVIGVCKVCGDVQTFMSRQAKELTKRDVTLVDRSNCTVQLTLWGEKAEQFDGSNNPVVCVRNARVSDFGGVSLSTLSSSMLLVNPDLQQAFELRGWYDNGGATMETQSLSDKTRGGEGAGYPANWKTFEQIRNENLGQGEKPDYITLKGTIIFLRAENYMYKACPSESCNKKVVDLEGGRYRCEKCSQTFDSFKWRLMLSINVADHTDAHWVMCFQDTAEKILGVTAAEMGELKENNQEQADNVFAEANFKSYIFRLRAKVEFFNDESRLKMTAMAVNPVDYSGDYGKRLNEEIEQLRLL